MSIRSDVLFIGIGSQIAASEAYGSDRDEFLAQTPTRRLSS
jgi:hypothetical protein